MLPDLNDLAIFAEVVDAKSFSEAARRLQLPTSTISRRVAALEVHLGVNLLTRSTRRLRLTETGAEMIEYARRSIELREAVSGLAANHADRISGTLRIAAPPSISDSLLEPLVGEFQAEYPEVRVQIFITDRIVNHIAEGIDLAFQVGDQDPANVAVRLLSYRHILLASPLYLSAHGKPKKPQDLHDHRLLAFSFWKPRNVWNFMRAKTGVKEAFAFQPHYSVNEYTGLAAALLAGRGIGELPPLVQPDLLLNGHLVEVMPSWHFRRFDLSLVHAANRFVPKIARLFKDFTVARAPQLFPSLPS